MAVGGAAEWVVSERALREKLRKEREARQKEEDEKEVRVVIPTRVFCSLLFSLLLKNAKMDLAIPLPSHLKSHKIQSVLQLSFLGPFLLAFLSSLLRTGLLFFLLSI